MIENHALQSFKIEVSRVGDSHLVAMQGSLVDDANTRAKETFLSILNDKPTRIVVDLGGVEYISSAGIGLLVSVLRRCRQRGTSMAVACLKPEVLELFKLTRLSQVFEIFETRAAAFKGH